MATKHTRRKQINQSIRFSVFEKHNGICCKCGRKTRFFHSLHDGYYLGDDRVAGSVDHIVPVSKGGTNAIDNLRWMCRHCNCSAGNRG